MLKRMAAVFVALAASLAVVTVSEQQAAASCSNPAYGNVWCWPSRGPLPPPHQPPPLRR